MGNKRYKDLLRVHKILQLIDNFFLPFYILVKQWHA